MKKILFITIVVLNLTHASYGQTASAKKEIYNSDFKWSITIPENFKTVSAEEWAKMQDKGKEAIEKTYEGKVENNTKTIFVFKTDQYNYFESNWQPFDTAVNGNYLETTRTVNEMFYGTFKAQLPDAKIDSASSQESIGGLTFHAYQLALSLPNNMVLKVWMFSRLFGKKEFTVNIMTVDKAKEELLLDAWRKSKFGIKK